MIDSKLIYGKNELENVVSIEIEDNHAFIYTEDETGIKEKRLDNEYWTLLHQDYDLDVGRLHGLLHYKYYIKHKTHKEKQQIRYDLRRKQADFFAVYDDVSAFQIKEGVSFFKGLKVEDVSVLSFDIETNGININQTSKVFLISNTYRKAGKTQKRLFSVDEYDNQGEMIDEWCKWVRALNPSVMLGHNIFAFDIPFLDQCSVAGLKLGRDGSTIKFDNYVRQFRKDGSQSYDYKNIRCYGRQVIDTFFLSIKYDVGRKYPSYGLKAIIEHEGLIKEGRQFYDAGSIRDKWTDLEEREKIKKYAIDDADDSLALYDLMIPSYFYYAKSIPMSFQEIILKATGSQTNTFMLRAYLQEKHSIPKGSDAFHFEGAISFGVPGIYNDVFKVDVASLYPSIMRQYKIYDKYKDPKKVFINMVEYFTLGRLKNKKLANETGDRYYRDLEQSQKISINSFFGFMGAPRLNFNSPQNAAKVTRYGREVLTKGMEWAEDLGYKIVNADTDSFSICDFKSDKQDFLNRLNDIYPELIKWEDDGLYKKFVIVKAKNYVLFDGDKVKIKGSGLKGTMKEPALREFMKDVIDALLTDKQHEIINIYEHYVKLISNITSTNIKEWCSKKTVTKSVLNPQRTNEQRVLDAIGDKPVQEGDKINVFFMEKDKLCLLENFNDVYDKDKLYEKLFKTIKIFENVLDITDFRNYKLKRNKEFL